jgi:hypothetical protein
MMFDWMPSIGSSEIRIFGSMSSAPDGQLLLLPIAQDALFAAKHFLEHRGKSVKTRSSSPLLFFPCATSVVNQK